VATGESHSVQEFTEAVFGYLDLDWRKHVIADRQFIRPLEVEYLQGDARRAEARLGWRPRTSFCELVRLMVDADLRRETILLEGTAKHKCAGAVL
jgi:GDPmannose 4,6-dehydratase